MNATVLVLLLSATPGPADPGEARPAQDASGWIDYVRWEDKKLNREFGIEFKVDFQVNGCYGVPCTLVMYFYDENKRPLRDRNKEFHTADGGVCTMEDFTPGFPRTKYTKYALFIPVNEFHVRPGKYVFYFRISIFRRDSNHGFHHVATSDHYKMNFRWRIPESGEITRLNVDHNHRSEGRNGIRATVDYSAHGMRGKKGRFLVEFYHYSPDLPLLYVHGDESRGAMSFTQEFDCTQDDMKFTGGWYWVPYEDFPLKVGRNYFYFKVYLQALSTDERWYDLDATTAQTFYYDNGTLKLREVWVIENLPVLLDWDPTEAESGTVRKTLVEFNRRLYDSSDGQIRVRSFVLRRMGGHPDHHYDGALRIYKNFKEGDHGTVDDGAQGFVDQGRPFAYLGSPDKLGDAHLAFDKMVSEGPSLYSRALVHEFHHAAFGLNDEYGERTDEKGNPTFGTFCARSEGLRRAWNCCIMGTYQPLHRELCKPDTHAVDESNPKLHKLDCYTRVQQALKRSLNKDLVIPQTPVEGPNDPPEPQFRLR